MNQEIIKNFLIEIKKNNLKYVKDEIKRDPSLVNSIHINDFDTIITPIITSITSGHLDIVNELLKNGANVNTVLTIDNKDLDLFSTVLYSFKVKYITVSKCLKIFDLLLKYNAIIHKKQRFISVLNNICNLEIIRFVLKKNLVNIEDLDENCKNKYNNWKNKYISNKTNIINALTTPGTPKRDSLGRFLPKEKRTRPQVLPQGIVQDILQKYLDENYFEFGRKKKSKKSKKKSKKFQRI